MKLSELKLNKTNPRKISDNDLEKLCQSITDFPKMMELRPIVIDDNGIVLGGNMRLKALRKLGMKEIPDNWVKLASELTDDEKRQFIVKDNIPAGMWDIEVLSLEYDIPELEAWGLELDCFGSEPTEENPKEPTIKEPEETTCPECGHTFIIE